MLAAAHVLAMDSKNLLDVVDNIRIRYPQIDRQVFKSMENFQEPTSNDQMDNSKIVDKSNISPTISPTAVSCTFVPVYTNNIQSPASSSNLSTNQSVDS